MTKYHYYLIAPVGAPVAAVRDLICRSRGDLSGYLEVTRALVSAVDPTGPTVAYCGSLIVTEDERRGLEGFESTYGPTSALGIYYARCDLDGQVLATNFPAAAGRIGRTWDTATALALVGLAFPDL